MPKFFKWDRFFGWLQGKGLMRANYRGDTIPTGAGAFFLTGSIITWIIFLISGLGNPDIIVRLIFLISVIGAAGLIDDMLGEKDFQGFRGHFSRLFKGRITTGAFKAIIAFITVLLVIDKTPAWAVVIINLGLILLMTNLINLLDLRPGRALKFFLLFSLLLLLSLPSFLIYALPIYLLSLFYLPYELQGRVMLGDTGANLLGAFLGLGYSYGLSLPVKIILLALLILLNLLAEKYSFTRIISGNRVLNWFDRLGRS